MRENGIEMSKMMSMFASESADHAPEETLERSGIEGKFQNGNDVKVLTQEHSKFTTIQPSLRVMRPKKCMIDVHLTLNKRL